VPKKTPSTSAITVLPPTFPLGLDASVTKDDLVSIKVSEFEQRLLAEQDSLQNKAKVVHKEAFDLREKAAKDAQAAADEKYGDALKALGEALAAFGKKPKLSIGARIEKEIVHATVHSAHRHHGDGGVEVTVEFPLPAVVKSGLAAARAKEAEYREISIRIIAVRDRLSKVSTVERAVRAELAKAKLRADGHAELIEQILAVEVPSLALPAPH
jgi:hypothetical protein